MKYIYIVWFAFAAVAVMLDFNGLAVYWFGLGIVQGINYA